MACLPLLAGTHSQYMGPSAVSKCRRFINFNDFTRVLAAVCTVHGSRWWGRRGARAQTVQMCALYQRRRPTGCLCRSSRSLGRSKWCEKTGNTEAYQIAIARITGCIAASALLGGIGDRKIASSQTEMCGNFQAEGTETLCIRSVSQLLKLGIC